MLKLLICFQLMIFGFDIIHKIKRYNYLCWRCQAMEQQLKESVKKDLEIIYEQNNHQRPKA